MRIVAFVPSRSPKTARPFFEDVLGLKVISEDQFAIAFDAAGTPLRLVDVSSVPGFKPAPFTILGWQVPDIEAAVQMLEAKGVVFERYEGMNQDRHGIWSSPNGARIGWFKDPDGNVLSIAQSQG